MIILIVFIVVVETGQFHVVLGFYVSKTKFACLHKKAKFSGQKKIEIKKTERRAGLRFDHIHKKLNYPKRFKRKLKMTYFLLKQ